MNTVFDSTVLFKEHPYRCWKNEDKSDSLGQGRPTSAPTCLSVDEKIFQNLL